MTQEKKQRGPLLTKQDLKDFTFAAVVTGGLEALLKPDGAPLGAAELGISAGIWGGLYGFMRARQYGKEAGIRSGAAAAAGAVVGNVCGYLINNYHMFM